MAAIIITMYKAITGKTKSDGITSDELEKALELGTLANSLFVDYARIYTARELPLHQWLKNYWYWVSRHTSTCAVLSDVEAQILQTDMVEDMWAKLVMDGLKEDMDFRRCFTAAVLAPKTATKIDWMEMKFYVPDYPEKQARA